MASSSPTYEDGSLGEVRHCIRLWVVWSSPNAAGRSPVRFVRRERLMRRVCELTLRGLTPDERRVNGYRWPLYSAWGRRTKKCHVRDAELMGGVRLL